MKGTTVSQNLPFFWSLPQNSFQLVATEFAEYTSAQERIALGKKSRKLEANKRRNEIQELIDDAM